MTAIISLFLLKLIFPRDKKTLLVLQQQLDKLREKHAKRKVRKESEKTDKSGKDNN
jgi:hypothetical protein